jgi:hypothetical protein
MQAGQNQKIVGTNCYNCKYIHEKQEQVYSDELNNAGGIDPKNDFEMYRAETTDLITLPGDSKSDVTDKRRCHHPKVDMYVTTRMCCALWDNDNVKRPWKEKNKD